MFDSIRTMSSGFLLVSRIIFSMYSLVVFVTLTLLHRRREKKLQTE